MLIIILLTITFLICFVIAGVIKYRFRFFTPISNVLNQKGIYISCNSGLLDIGQEYIPFVTNKKEIKKNLNKVEDVLGMYQLAPLNMNYRKVYGWAYDFKTSQIIIPEMKSGRWFKPDDGSSKIIKAVVSDPYDIVSVGDVVTLNITDVDRNFEVEIIGIIKDDSYVYGLNIEQFDICEDIFSNANYINAFGNYKDEKFDVNSKYLSMFFLNEQLQKSPMFSDEGGGDGIGCQRIMTGPQFIIYKNDINEKEIRENEEKLILFDSMSKISFSEMKKNSVNYIMLQLNILMPLFFVALCLATISLISVELLSVKTQMEEYSVFYLQGMPWKSCIAIHIIHQMLITLIAIGIAFGGYYYFAVRKDLNIEIAYDLGMLFCILTMLFNIVISLFVPTIIIYRTQPVTLFHKG